MEKSWVKKIIFSLVLPVIVVIFLASILSSCENINKAKSIFGGSPIIKKDKISLGYTLLSPLTTHQNFAGSKKVYLLDLLGNPVHVWNTKYLPFISYIKQNGNLVVALRDPNAPPAPSGGKTGIIQELDWQGKVVWEYKDQNIHHDFDILENGNIIAVAWERVPKELAAQIKGGVLETEFDGDVWADKVIEIDRNGQIVWTWHAYEHLDPGKDILGPLVSRADWTHINSIRFVLKDPIKGEPGFLISMRSISLVIFISQKTGEIIWQSPPSMFSHQHDATLLENGNILVFDNGLYQKPNPKVQIGSRVVEIDPKTKKIVWEFKNGSVVSENAKFSPAILSGAQRLKNGNTLITDGVNGHIFEITPDKKIVWDFINPFTTFGTGVFPNSSIFKSRRYQKEEITEGRKLPPAVPFASNICQRLFN